MSNAISEILVDNVICTADSSPVLLSTVWVSHSQQLINLLLVTTVSNATPSVGAPDLALYS